MKEIQAQRILDQTLALCIVEKWVWNTHRLKLPVLDQLQLWIWVELWVWYWGKDPLQPWTAQGSFPVGRPGESRMDLHGEHYRQVKLQIPKLNFNLNLNCTLRNHKFKKDEMCTLLQYVCMKFYRNSIMAIYDSWSLGERPRLKLHLLPITSYTFFLYTLIHHRVVSCLLFDNTYLWVFCQRSGCLTQSRSHPELHPKFSPLFTVPQSPWPECLWLNDWLLRTWAW